MTGSSPRPCVSDHHVPPVSRTRRIRPHRTAPTRQKNARTLQKIPANRALQNRPAWQPRVGRFRFLRRSAGRFRASGQGAAAKAGASEHPPATSSPTTAGRQTVVVSEGTRWPRRRRPPAPTCRASSTGWSRVGVGLVEFRVLGPLEARGRRARSARRPQQRALLAVLLLHANEVVSSDRLIDELWGERPPATAAKALQVYVSRLRKVRSGDGRLLVTRAPGYELRVEPERLDLRPLRAPRRARAARRSPQGARRARRPSSAGGAGAVARPAAGRPRLRGVRRRREIARLEELRLAALSDRIDADSRWAARRAGRRARGAVAEHPLRERLRGQLMLALYRSGRQAEALAGLPGRAPRAGRRARDRAGPRSCASSSRRSSRQDPALDLAPRGRAGAGGRGPRARSSAASASSPTLSPRSTTRSPAAAACLIAGEPGIGKSRLAEELRRRARERAARGCSSGAAGRRAARRRTGRGSRRCAPTSATPSRRRCARSSAPARRARRRSCPSFAASCPTCRASPAAESEGARFRLFDAVAVVPARAAADAAARALPRRPARGRRALAAAAALRGRAARRRAAADRRLLPRHRGRPGAGRDAAPSSRATATQRRLRCSGLGGVGHRAPARADHRATRRPTLWPRRSTPRPRATRCSSREVGRLLAAEGEPHAARAADPEGVREAIGRRLQRAVGRLPRRARPRVGARARVRPGRARPRSCGLEEDELFAALDEAVDAGLVGDVAGAAGRLRFSHVLIRDALYDELPAPRRLRLHRASARRSSALYAGNPEPHLRRARPPLPRGGRRRRPRRRSPTPTAPGDRAASQHAYEEAARHYGSALRCSRPRGRATRERTCDLLLALGEVAQPSGPRRPRRGRRCAARPRSPSERLARPARARGARLRRAVRVGAGQHRPRLVPLLRARARRGRQEDSLARVRLLARLAAARRDDPPRERGSRSAPRRSRWRSGSAIPGRSRYALEGYWAAAEGPDGRGGHRPRDARDDRAGRADRRAGADLRRARPPPEPSAARDRAAVDVEFDALAELGRRDASARAALAHGTERTLSR